MVRCVQGGDLLRVCGTHPDGRTPGLSFVAALSGTRFVMLDGPVRLESINEPCRVPPAGAPVELCSFTSQGHGIHVSEIDDGWRPKVTVGGASVAAPIDASTAKVIVGSPPRLFSIDRIGEARLIVEVAEERDPPEIVVEYPTFTAMQVTVGVSLTLSIEYPENWSPPVVVTVDPDWRRPDTRLFPSRMSPWELLQLTAITCHDIKPLDRPKRVAA